MTIAIAFTANEVDGILLALRQYQRLNSHGVDTHSKIARIIDRVETQVERARIAQGPDTFAPAENIPQIKVGTKVEGSGV